MSLDWSLISSEALNSLDLDHLIEGVEQRECFAYGEELSRLQQNEARWSPQQLECLRFAGQVLAMMLKPDQPGEPYGPMFVFGDRRSAIPADFPKAELLAVQGWAMSLDDPELRARFLDVLWLQARLFPAAPAAVEAYLASAVRLEHPEEWTACQERLERALRLAASLGKGGTDLRSRVLCEIAAMLQRHRGADPLYLSFRLIQLLLEFKHGDASQYAGFATTAAITAREANEFWRARDYYKLAAACYRMAGDENAEGAALREAAESLVKEAELAHGQPGRSAIAAASILSDAVEAMRQAPVEKTGRPNCMSSCFPFSKRP